MAPPVAAYGRGRVRVGHTLGRGLQIGLVGRHDQIVLGDVILGEYRALRGLVRKRATEYYILILVKLTALASCWWGLSVRFGILQNYHVDLTQDLDSNSVKCTVWNNTKTPGTLSINDGIIQELPGRLSVHVGISTFRSSARCGARVVFSYALLAIRVSLILFLALA